MKYVGLIAALALAASPLSSTAAPDATLKVTAANVLAEEVFLAGPTLRGRGSATPDEAKAADYVASLFRDLGLKPAPGMTGFLQTAPLVRKQISGAPVLAVGGVAVPGVSVILTSGGTIGGKAAIVSDIGGPIPDADVLVYTGPADKLT
ncbi:MAG: hypothetical protein V4459_03930 [Pseudomonadota bacterium]